MRRLLILGDGFLGKNLKSLFAGEFDVCSTTRRRANVGEDEYFFQVDQMQDFQNLILSSKPDIVINCIAITNIEDCELNKNLAHMVNLEFPIFAAQCLEEIDSGIKFIHISTDHFDSEKYDPRNESVEMQYPNYYSFSKMRADELLGSYFSNSLVLRTNFFGHDRRFSNSLFDFAIINFRKSLEIIGYTDVFFNPVSIPILSLIIHKLIYSQCTGVYNVSSKRVISKFDFLLMIETIGFGGNRLVKEGSIYSNSNLIKRANYLALDNSKLVTSLDLEIPTIESMIKDMLDQITPKR
jgi:dTDP-4-dehydrorhamnose reductase